MFDVSSLDARPGTETPGFLTVAEMTENYSTTESGAVSTRANVGPVLANLLSSRGISQETAAGVGAAFASGQTSIVAARGKYIEVRLSDGVIRQLRDRTVMDGDATQRAHLYNCILELALSRHDYRLLTGLSGFYMESLEINSNFNRDFELAVEAAVSNPDEEVAVLELRGEVASSLNGEFRSLVTSEFRQFSQETFRYGAIAYTSPYTFFVFAGQGNVRIPALGGRRRVEICNGGEHRQTGTSNNYLQVVIADQPGRVPAVDVAGVDLPLQTHGHRHMRCRTYRLESPLDIAFYDMDPSNQAEVASIEGTVAFFR
ncbi:hypothetical protein AWH62_04620 [Maricaulis sp. W15]|uniref:hypothetical protein n=1 Tax=Maricaulis sp. W15 TaxID=1772333 RepID=UPI000948B9A2|nr:hypothetical protein [Maricaulis sp. W15]OLF77955.1 hypothetical protein AWH62_04620 [Maricaulis sp. W15]